MTIQRVAPVWDALDEPIRADQNNEIDAWALPEGPSSDSPPEYAIPYMDVDLLNCGVVLTDPMREEAEREARRARQREAYARAMRRRRGHWR